MWLLGVAYDRAAALAGVGGAGSSAGAAVSDAGGSEPRTQGMVLSYSLARLAVNCSTTIGIHNDFDLYVTFPVRRHSGAMLSTSVVAADGAVRQLSGTTIL